MSDVTTTVETFADNTATITFSKVNIEELDALFLYLGSEEGRETFVESLRAAFEQQFGNLDG